MIVLIEGFDDRFLPVILTGISREAACHNLYIPIYSIEISDFDNPRTPDPVRLSARISKLLGSLDYEVSGIIYIAQYPRRLDGLLDDLSIPIVFAFCWNEGSRDVIHYDDRQGALLAVNALLEEGRSRIAMISGPIDSTGMYLRSAGYQQALMEHQLPYDPRLVRISDWDEKSGYEQTMQLLDEELPFDAVFAQNDSIGVGVARAILERGLSIPEDISIIGFDDSPFCYHTTPALTSICPPLSQIGQNSLRRLLAILEAETDKPASPETQLLACKLVRRNSTL